MPKFAKTLERIRDNPEDFYYGELAKDIVQDVKDGGGIFTLDDLKNYRVKFKTPLSGTLGDYTWYSTPPPGSGAVLSLILNILKGKLQLHFSSGFCSSACSFALSVFRSASRMLEQGFSSGSFSLLIRPQERKLD